MRVHRHTLFEGIERYVKEVNVDRTVCLRFTGPMTRLAPPTTARAGAGLALGAIVCVQIGIALSAIGLGAAVLFEAKPKLGVAAALVGFFAIFHGHAHGTELPPGANGLLYSIGFVVATGLLHRSRFGRPADERRQW